MNLCLRSAGRSAACEGLRAEGAAEGGNASSVASRLLDLCEALVESKNDQVRGRSHRARDRLGVFTAPLSGGFR